MTTTAELPRIPLSALHLSPLNARKTRNQDTVDAMAASIVAHSLLQNLTVTVNDNPGEYEVVAGGYRLLAMQQLEREGRLPASLQIGVPCLVIEDNDVAHEASTAENTLREAMHPADQFEAFSRMVEAGKPVEDIAAHFGVTETVVRQRLKLARVAPELFQLYRDGDMELSQLQAFTVTDDHDRQRQVWKDAGHQNTAWQLRRALIGSKSVPTTDKLVRFVGVEAYEAAGGAVRRDLFGEGAWCEDKALLDSLAMDRLEARAQALREAGWSWVELHLDMEYAYLEQHPPLRGYEHEDYLPPEAQARHDAIHKRIAEIEDIEADDVSDLQNVDLENELQALYDEAEAIENTTEERWPPEAMAKSGVIVTIHYDGIIAHYARLRPGEKAGKPSPAGATQTSGAAPTKPKKPELSADMVGHLEKHRAAALRIKLLDNPQIAADLLLADMVSKLFGDVHYGAFDLRAHDVHDSTASKLPDLANCDARTQLDDARSLLRIPRKRSDLLPWVQKLDDSAWSNVLATCAAHLLRNLTSKELAEIETAVALDMRDWWAPDVVRFTGQVQKSLVLDAVTEACGKDAAGKIAGLKKDALATEAAKLLAGTGWLPKPLRGPGYKLKAAEVVKKTAANKAKPAAKKATAKKLAKKAAPAKTTRKGN